MSDPMLYRDRERPCSANPAHNADGPAERYLSTGKCRACGIAKSAREYRAKNPQPFVTPTFDGRPCRACPDHNRVDGTALRYNATRQCVECHRARCREQWRVRRWARP